MGRDEGREGTMKERSEAAATARNLVDDIVLEIRFHLDSRRIHVRMLKD